MKQTNNYKDRFINDELRMIYVYDVFIHEDKNEKAFEIGIKEHNTITETTLTEIYDGKRVPVFMFNFVKFMNKKIKNMQEDFLDYYEYEYKIEDIKDKMNIHINNNDRNIGEKYYNKIWETFEKYNLTESSYNRQMKNEKRLDVLTEVLDEK